jgi:hypothetical protein
MMIIDSQVHAYEANAPYSRCCSFGIVVQTLSRPHRRGAGSRRVSRGSAPGARMAQVEGQARRAVDARTLSAVDDIATKSPFPIAAPSTRLRTYTTVSMK